ncbi:MAG TPA: hypothetical protein VFU74_09265 [Actinocrinis sp.]|nr:hypothetical protein [Actinocrinis sp.]
MTAQQDSQHEQVADPRRADVEYTRQLLDAAQQSGLVALPDLTVNELLVLGAGEQAVLDEALVHAWEGLPDELRYQRAEATIAGLVERGLLEPVPAESAALAAPDGADPSPGADEQHMRMHPALATILLARTFPTWIGLCSIQDGQRTDLRMYGLGDLEDAYRGVVVETLEPAPSKKLTPDTSDNVAATSYHYRLASISAAATLLANWAISLPDADPADEPAQAERLIDLFVHRDGEPLLRWRIQVRPDQQGIAHVRTGEQYEPHARDSLIELLYRLVSTLRSG